MPEPHLRAADADRTAVASVLGEHMAAGRLTVAEYEERLTHAYAAKTYGELAELTADLPGGATPVVRGSSAPARREDGPARRGGWPDSDAWAWRTWASTAAIVISIWAITSLASWSLLYFWPIWVIGPWGVVLFIQSFGDDDDVDDDDERQLPDR